MCRWSPGMLPKVKKLVGIEHVRLRNCGLGWNATLSIVLVPFQNFDVVWVNFVICCFGVVPNCTLTVRSCSRLVFCNSWNPRSLTFSEIDEITFLTLDFVNDSFDLINGGAVFRLLKNAALCFNGFECSPNVFLAEHTSNSPLNTLYIRDWSLNPRILLNFWLFVYFGWIKATFDETLEVSIDL